MFGFMKKKDSGAAPAVQSKKSKGFYLELDEATSLAPTPKTTASASSAVPAPEVAATPEVVAPEAIVAPEPKLEVATEPTAPTKAPKAPRSSKTASEPVPAPAATPTLEPVAAVVPEPEILPAYLVMNDTPRRRPGANMAMFKEMAQKIGTSIN